MERLRGRRSRPLLMLTYALILVAKLIIRSVKNMGLFDFIYSHGGNLKAVPQPIGVHPQMCHGQLTTLVLKESLFSISGDDFSITDAKTEEPVLKCAGKMISFHDRKKLYDAKGNLMFNISSDKSFNPRKSMVGNLQNGHEGFEVHVRRGMGTKLAASFINIGGERKTVHLDGDMFGRTANLKLADDGTHLAHIARELVNVTDYAADKQTYYLTVAPNVDLSLMAAICICFDEIKNDAEAEDEEQENARR